jgi:hypothetical protein
VCRESPHYILYLDASHLARCFTPKAKGRVCFENLHGGAPVSERICHFHLVSILIP